MFRTLAFDHDQFVQPFSNKYSSCLGKKISDSSTDTSTQMKRILGLQIT